MLVNEFVQEFKNKKIINTRTDDTIVSKYIKDTLEIKTYLPFREKRKIAERVVAQNTEEVNGVMMNDSISQYVSFVVAMLDNYTNLEFSEDSVADYDLLAEAELLPLIINEFKSEYSECEVLLKMALAAEMQHNDINMAVGRFLNGILNRIDIAGEALMTAMEGVNLNEILGANFKEEDLAKLSSFLNKYNQ